jgi:phosphate transport system substrate-binding protein
MLGKTAAGARMSGRCTVPVLLAWGLAACSDPPSDPELLRRQLQIETVRHDPVLPPRLVQSHAPIGTDPTPLGETASRTEPKAQRILPVSVGHGAAACLGDGFEARFEAACPDVDLALAQHGDRNAVETVLQGQILAAVAAGILSPRDQHAGLRQKLLGFEVFVLVVSPRTDMRNLSRFQMRELLTGRITGWSRVGGAAGRVVVVLPGDPALVDRAARVLVPGEALAADGLRVRDETAVFDRVRDTPGAIGLARLAAARRDTGVRVLSIDTVPPGAGSFAAGTYPFGVAIALVTAGQPAGLVARFAEFLTSPEGSQHLGRSLTLPDR